jgi:hypothetical protein
MVAQQTLPFLALFNTLAGAYRKFHLTKHDSSPSRQRMTSRTLLPVLARMLAWVEVHPSHVRCGDTLAMITHFQSREGAQTPAG